MQLVQGSRKSLANYIAARPPPPKPRGRRPSQRMSDEHRRLALAFLLSLLFHGLLLSLTFSGQGLGLPGLGFPWQERRIEVPDLRVLLVPSPVTLAQPAAASEQPSGDDRAAGWQWSGPDSTGVARAAPETCRPRDRAGGQTKGRDQVGTKRRGPWSACESAFARRWVHARGAREDPETGCDRRGAVRQTQISRADRSQGATFRDRGSARRLEPGDP